ncbi:hypothetical protein Tcan_09525 [Toxocara canis]|uniref:Peptidase S1 domain-containing protein n=1 Tax=Toxocara canis TaxID=6265 RepID=A0A0B2VRF0_TOXCA|nr:hypothetical protein Tcan_09525 [Toxocara canis]
MLYLLYFLVETAESEGGGPTRFVSNQTDALYDLPSNKRTSAPGQLHYFEVNSSVSEHRCRTIASEKNSDICKRLIINVHNITTKRSICEGDSGGGVSTQKGGTHFLVGVINRGLCYCTPRDPSILAALGYIDESLKVSSYHDFICFYTGVCPMGYNRYLYKRYMTHPQKAYVLRSNTGKYSIGNVNVSQYFETQNWNRSILKHWE